MVRCVRLWTGPDGNSHFRDGRCRGSIRNRPIRSVTCDHICLIDLNGILRPGQE